MTETRTLGSTAQRLIGVALVLLGIGLTYYFVALPYQAMVAGADVVEFGAKSAAIGPALVVIGLIQIVLGPRFTALFGREAGINWKTLALGACIGVVAFGSYVWLDTQATALGYEEG